MNKLFLVVVFMLVTYGCVSAKNINNSDDMVYALDKNIEIFLRENGLKEGGAGMCFGCQYVLGKAIGYLKSNTTVLTHVCDPLPSSYKTMCYKFMESEGDMLVNLLLTYADPKVVCEKIGFC
ncbi:Pro saposin-like type B [Orpheovirus IHUMI-LCC2]|uniref:Pro saposin-like type B n=1 Tax=Orpheovirus IHUMI-LCC2 TaxID=2023057 RepID=A0A2I2L3A7_9VIRU|nr:Pro saposin-like type B [Orpheovirus IHUMI-LCC2]SNW61959.1 Pro saposin-like type B [Orpheovirus IHUMI-LCC2]